MRAPDYRSALKALVAVVGEIPAREVDREFTRAYSDAYSLIFGDCPTCGVEVERAEDGTVPICVACVCVRCGAPATTSYDALLCGDRVCEAGGRAA